MNNNQSFSILAGVAFSIIMALILIPAQSDDTIFFIKEDNSGPPTACTGNLGLVLAQNLTDLCDVTIINATSGQFIEYNGTQWVNIDVTIGSGNATVLEDLGDVCENVSPTFDFAFFRFDPNDSCWRDMSASLDDLSDVDVPSPTQGDVLTWDTTGFSAWKDLPNIDTTQCINVGGGILLIKNSTSGICYVKSLVAGSGITISNSTDTITITNSAPDNTVCANVGSGTQVYKDGECNFKTLVGSADISITNTTNTVVIDYNGTHVTSVTSNNNNTIGVTPTTGAVVLYPKYELLCQTTLSSSNATITCDIPARKHLHYTLEERSTGGTGIEPAIRFNNDAGSNYNHRISSNGGADSTANGITRCNFYGAGTLFVSGDTGIIEGWIYNNQSGDDKFMEGNTVHGSNSLLRAQYTCRWDNNVSQITRITVISFSGTGSFDTGSVLTVWGYN